MVEAGEAPVEVVTTKTEAKEPPLEAVMEKHDDVVQDKPVVLPPQEQPSTKAAAAAAKVPEAEPPVKHSSKGSFDRDVALAKLEDDKRLSFIKAWEENERTKVENKAQKKISEVSAWENSKRAALECQLKKFEEQLEKKKAEYAEKVNNKVAIVHKQAEEKRGVVQAILGEELLKAEETAAKYRATGHAPPMGCGCFGG